MTFTYDGDGSTDLDKIRFKIADVIEDAGVRPGTGSVTNFTDEEIAWILEDEGSVNRAIAGLYESLASQWQRYVNTQVGSRREELKAVADGYRALAKQWRDKYGEARSEGGFIVGLWDNDLSENDSDTSS